MHSTSASSSTSRGAVPSTMGPPSFPSRRNILWDRTCAGVVRHLPHGPRPIVLVPSTVSLHMGYRRGSLLTHHRVDVAADTSTGELHLAVERYDALPRAEVAPDNTMTVIECLPSEQDLFHDAYELIKSKMQQKTPPTADKFFALSAIAHADRHSSSVRIDFYAQTIRLPFTLAPLRPVPIVCCGEEQGAEEGRTKMLTEEKKTICPLAERLFKNLTRSGRMDYGYLTMDKTRKAVPMLEQDPAVATTPLVGVWVDLVNVWVDAAGAAGGGEGGEERFLGAGRIAPRATHAKQSDAQVKPVPTDHVEHPLIWQACMRFVTNEQIRERVFVAARTFLCIVVYRTGERRCFEVSYPYDVAAPASGSAKTQVSHQRLKLNTYRGSVDLDYDSQERKRVELRLENYGQEQTEQQGPSMVQVGRSAHDAPRQANQHADFESILHSYSEQDAVKMQSVNISPSQSPRAEVFWGCGVPRRSEKANLPTMISRSSGGKNQLPMRESYVNESNLLLQATDDVEAFAAQWDALKKQYPAPRVGVSLDESVVSSKTFSKNEKLWGFLQKQQDQLASLQQKVVDLTSALGAKNKAECRSSSVAVNTSVQVLRKDDLGIGVAQPRQHPPFQEDVLEPAPAFSHLSSIVGPLQTVLERERAGPAVIRPQHPQQQQQQYAAHPFSLSSDAMQQRQPQPSSRSVSMATSSSLHPRDSLREEPVESYREERASGSRRAAPGAHQQPPRDSPRGRELEASPRTSGSASHSVRSRAPDREIGFHKNKVASPSPSSIIKIAVLPPKSPPPKFPDWGTGVGPAVLAPADADRLQLVDDAQGVEADGGQLGHEDDEDSLMSSGWATLPASSSGARGGKTKTRKDSNIVGSGDEEDADGQSTPSSSLDEDDEELLDERKLPAKLIPVSAQGALRLKARAQEAGNHGSAEAAGNKTSAEVAASTSSTSRNNEPSAPRKETAIGSGGKNSAHHLTATTSSSTTAARPQRTETTTSSSSTAAKANNTSTKKFIDIPRIQYTAISDDEFSDGEESLLGDEDGDDALDGSDDEEVSAILAKYTRNLQ